MVNFKIYQKDCQLHEQKDIIIYLYNYFFYDKFEILCYLFIDLDI